MAAPLMRDPSPAYAEAVGEITKIYKSLPPRPSIEEVEAAISVVKSVDAEEEMRLEEISKQVAPQDTPPELFTVLQQLRKAKVLFQSLEQRREALFLIELDKRFQGFDQLIRSASEWVSGVDPVVIGSDFSGEIDIDESVIITQNEDGLKGLVRSSSSKALALSSSGLDYSLFLFLVFILGEFGVVKTYFILGFFKVYKIAAFVGLLEKMKVS